MIRERYYYSCAVKVAISLCLVNNILTVFSVVSQNYASEIISEYVIRGNNAVLKCSIPAFVADFVQVVNWVDSDNHVIEMGTGGEEIIPQRA